MTDDDQHRWTAFDTRFGSFAIAIDGQGRLVRLRFHRDQAPGTRDDAALAPIRAQIEEFCAGERRSFDFETHAETGSAFERAVWKVMCEIPYGETVSYGFVAKAVGQPGGAQAVGLACNSNPIALVWPCHRVIGANGALTGFGGGLPLKRKLLDFESVIAGRPRDLFATA